MGMRGNGYTKVIPAHLQFRQWMNCIQTTAENSIIPILIVCYYFALVTFCFNAPCFSALYVRTYLLTYCVIICFMRRCLVYNWLTDYIPTVFHTTSVWLTVTLAAQRYLYVCHSVIAKRFCTVSNIVKASYDQSFSLTALALSLCYQRCVYGTNCFSAGCLPSSCVRDP